MQREFEAYLQAVNLEALMSQLTELCFLSKTREPKQFIANFCSSGQPDQHRKYKEKYKAAKLRIETLNKEVCELKEELAVLNKNLVELRKLR